jgi:hypothetical protein
LVCGGGAVCANRFQAAPAAMMALRLGPGFAALAF